MELIQINQDQVQVMSNPEQQLALLQQLEHTLKSELLSDQNMQKISEITVNQLNKNSHFNALNEGQKMQFVGLGLQILKSNIETTSLKLQTQVLETNFQKIRSQFLNQYQEKLETLKTVIEQNKADFLQLKQDAESLSLNSLANRINQFHNPNKNTSVTDDDIDHLLNGGDIEL